MVQEEKAQPHELNLIAAVVVCAAKGYFQAELPYFLFVSKLKIREFWPLVLSGTTESRSHHLMPGPRKELAYLLS